MDYKQKYLKYKEKYLNLKGGRLLDIIDLPGNVKIKNNCDDITKIESNFNLCNKINDKLATSNNSYVIFLWLLSSPDFPSLKALENIILNHKAKSSNIKIFSHESFTTPNSSISSEKIDNSNFISKIKAEITRIITNHASASKETINITIYNGAHGNMNTFNTPNFINGDPPTISISKDNYFDIISPVFNSNNFVNLTLVNNNCYSTYTIHGYFKNKIRSLSVSNKTNVSLYTYSLRPFMKYLLYLRFILLFFTKDFMITYGSKMKDADKFTIFMNLNTQIKSKLDTDSTFLRDVENIFYETKDEIKSELDILFNLFNPSTGNFKYLNEIFSKITSLYINVSTVDKGKVYFCDAPNKFTDVKINSVDLYNDLNITNNIIGYLEQSNEFTSQTWLQLKINNENLAWGKVGTIDFTFNVNNSIKDINSSLRTSSEFLDGFLLEDEMVIAGLPYLLKLLNKDLVKKLIQMSFDKQKDILIVPVEPDDTKREIMRNKKLIDLL
jgi:hypothetical protein